MLHKVFSSYSICNTTQKCKKYYTASSKNIKNCMLYFEFISFGLWTLDC